MRYSELFETVEMLNVDNIKDFNAIIQRDCQPFLQQSKGKPLYRGLKDNIPEIAKIDNIRSKPNDVSNWNHIMFDIGLKRTGHIAGRSNSIFGSGDIGLAYQYGRIYRIYPIGDFSFTYHPDASDFINVLNGNNKKKVPNWRQGYSLTDIFIPSLWNINEILRFKKTIEPQYKDYLLKLPDWRREQALVFKKDVANYTLNILLDMGVSAEKIVDDFANWSRIDRICNECNSTNLIAGLKKSVEIMVACKQYYAIEHELYQQFAKEGPYAV